MATQLPYLASYKNVPVLFEKIATAKVPDSFTHNFLQNTIGLKGTADRSLISFLRSLGFVDSSNRPTPQYNLLKGPQRKVALADGIRAAYRPVFDADEEAYQHTGEKLRGLISQVAGTDADMTARIANTFAAVVKLGDFSGTLKDEQKKKRGKKIKRTMWNEQTVLAGQKPCARNFITIFMFTFLPTGLKRRTRTYSTRSARASNELGFASRFVRPYWQSRRENCSQNR
jgi:hypothetical protein